MTTPTPDRTPTGDLRERLAEALYQWTLNAAGASRTSPPVHPRTLENLHANSLARADAVLPVVEAETAELRAHDTECKRVWDEYPKAIERLREAERQRDEALAAADRVRDLCARMRSHPDTRKWADRIEAALEPPEPKPGEEQGAPVDWEAIVRQRERELKRVGEARHQAESAVARLRILHEPVEVGYGNDGGIAMVCSHCFDGEGAPVLSPCPTLAALEPPEGT